MTFENLRDAYEAHLRGLRREGSTVLNFHRQAGDFLRFLERSWPCPALTGSSELT